VFQIIVPNNLGECILQCTLFLWCKGEFSASLLQSSVSHDPSEIILIWWFAAQETFIIIINFENSAASYFVETIIHSFSAQKNCIYLKYMFFFPKILNVFTVTFGWYCLVFSSGISPVFSPLCSPGLDFEIVRKWQSSTGRSHQWHYWTPTPTTPAEGQWQTLTSAQCSYIFRARYIYVNKCTEGIRWVGWPVSVLGEICCTWLLSTLYPYLRAKVLPREMLMAYPTTATANASPTTEEKNPTSGTLGGTSLCRGQRLQITNTALAFRCMGQRSIKNKTIGTVYWTFMQYIRIFACFLLSIIFDTSGFYGSYTGKYEAFFFHYFQKAFFFRSQNWAKKGAI